jgi:hypothetical protein
VAAIMYRLDLRAGYRLALAVTACTLMFAGHYGGSLTHGRSYLTEHAPAPFRALFGRIGARASLGKSGEVADQNVFAGLVQPILAARCVACHGPEKQKGHLRLDSFESVIRGGETPVIVAGRSTESELVRRINLPLVDEDHMPPKGKPQLTLDEIAVLRWWVDAGAPANKTVRELNPSESVSQSIKRTAESGN